MNPEIDDLCKEKYKGHDHEYIIFCEDCADKLSEDKIHKAFICGRCHANQKKKHNDKEHDNFYSITNKQKFCQKIISLREHIRMHPEICDLTKISDQNIDELCNSKNYLQAIQDNNFRLFLLKMKFWKCSGGNRNVTQEISTQISIYVNKLKPKQEEPEPQWNNLEGVIEEKADQAEKIIENEMRKLQKDQEILDIIIEVQSAYQISHYDVILKKMKQIDQPQGQKILEFLKLKIYTEKGQPKNIRLTLEDICRKDKYFSKKWQYHYYNAQTHWIKVNQQIRNDDQKLLFYDQRFGYIFELENPEQFVNSMTEVILQTKEKFPKFKLLRGLGYCVQRKWQSAKKDFKSAFSSNQKSSTAYVNLNYTKWKLNEGIEDDFLRFDHKNRGFLVSAIKYFKISKNYKEMSQFCNKLLELQPNNMQLIEKFIISLLKQGKIDEAQLYLGNISKPDRLIRKKLYAKGRTQIKQTKYGSAINTYREVVSRKKTASGLFNLAVSYFNQTNFDDSLQGINEALKINDKKKYRKLKFKVLVCMKKFDEAKQMMHEFREDNELREVMNFLDQV